MKTLDIVILVVIIVIMAFVTGISLGFGAPQRDCRAVVAVEEGFLDLIFSDSAAEPFLFDQDIIR